MPSASRTLGVAPIAYILVASGLWWLLQLRRPAWPRWLVPTVAGVLLAAILLLNAQRYFRDYIADLPYQNTPIGRIIATYLDALPPETQIYLVGCCWEHSLPEPLSVQYVMARPERFSAIDPEHYDMRLAPAAAAAGCAGLELVQTHCPALQVDACRAVAPGAAV